MHPPRVASPPAASRTPTAEVDPTLTAEITAIEQARQRWRTHDGDGVLAAVAAYRARFPKGGLFPEAAWLAANALAARGDREGARREGDALRARDPKSPYVRLIEQLAAR